MASPSADPQRVIALLSEQVAALVRDNAILTSMVETLSQAQESQADEP